MSVVCQQCSKVYSSQSNLNRHLSEVHNTKRSVISYDKIVYGFKCLEKECNSSFKLNEELRDHLKAVHAFNIEEEVLEFNDFQEFQQWLNELQKSSNIEYIQPCGKRIKGNSEIIYYNCNRSGKSRKSGHLLQRMRKIEGSSKINYACTSQIKVIVSNKCTAFYYKTHYGHDIELQHLRVSKNDKAIIAGKLTSGVSISRILDTNRANFNEGKLKRIDLLTRKDIHNIKTSYNVQIVEGVRHSEDAISVDLFVEECKQLESNPILFYKRQGEEHPTLLKEDFVIMLMNTSQENMLRRFGHNIIAIDSTHGLNSYDFQLSTVLVVDDWGEGFPGACLLTNRQDSLIFEIFFDAIKSKIGVLEPKTFMSDITNVFYKAWLHVMGPVPNQLFCAWHIDRAWQSNLNKISDLEKRRAVYHSLKSLQTTTDKEEFHQLLASFRDHVLNDEATQSFGLYFTGNYENNYQKWAYCYRKCCGINTNMRLESMHKTIKYLYLDAKKVKRLDKGLYALNKYIRDKVVDRIIKHVKGKNTFHIKEIYSRHKTALNSTFQIKLCKDGVWNVITDQKVFYTIKRNLPSPCCHLMCQACNVCIHCFSCTCTDFFIHSSICKHIHYIVLKNELRTSSEFVNDYEQVENNVHLKTLSQGTSGHSRNKETLIKNITLETNKLQQHISTVNNVELLTHVVNILQKENSLIENSNNIQPFDSSDIKNVEPPNKKIKKQLTFHSTRNKRKLKGKHLRRPTEKESSDIRNVLLNKVELISSNALNDHNYCKIQDL